MANELWLNLGGEGEEAGAINQQPEWVAADPRHWQTVSPRFAPLLAAGEAFLFCKNLAIPLPDGSIDLVITNHVPIDRLTWLGPGIPSSEIRRILKSGGGWRHDGVLVFSKP